jgi:hypothetical protein
MSAHKTISALAAGSAIVAADLFVSVQANVTYKLTAQQIADFVRAPLSAIAFSGSASDLVSGTVPAARLPAPAAATLGGVKSSSASAHQFATGINTTGAVTYAQPAAADVSGLAASATTDTTNAGNISSGNLNVARLPVLAAAYLWVGNGTSVATAVTLSGDATISNAGAVTVTKANVATNNFSLKDDADNTKVVKLSAANVPTASTRTFSFPDANDTLVVVNAAQTLVNKTLTSPATSVDVNSYALVAGRFSAGVGRAVFNTAGAYGYELQVNGTRALQLDANVLNVSGADGADSLRVYNTGATKFVTIKPETASNTAQLGYWTGASMGTLALVGTVTGTTSAQAANNTTLATNAYADRVAVQQTVSTLTGAVATGTTTIPGDDTIPQNTEGDQYMSVTITPKSATSLLRIYVDFTGSSSAGASTFAVALFQDSIASALKSKLISNIFGAGGIFTVTFAHAMTSGTTSPITFKVRAGQGAAGTTTFNGSAGSRYMGGAMPSSIIVEEIGV